MYQAFGLNIDSEVSFPAMEPGIAPSDVRISRGRVAIPWASGNEERRMYVREYQGDIYIVWHTESNVEQRILVQSGKDIIVDADLDSSQAMITQAIQGLGLGLLLHQRKQYVLHASSVEVNGEAVVFIGFKGAGKSTTASALFAHGHPLVTDDLLAVEMPQSDSRAYAKPGIPGIKLWPDSVKASLGEDPQQLPRIFSREEKRYRRLREGFVKATHPIRCVYVLEYSDEPMDRPSITRLKGGDACIELIRHSYGVRMLGPGGRNRTHFLQTNEFLKRVPVYRLSRPRSLEHIPLLVQCIEEHGT